MKKTVEFLRLLDNEYASVAEDGIVGGDVGYFCDTGNYAFNGLISGSMYDGIPSGVITAIAGRKGCGKTYILLSAIKEFHKKYPEGIVILFETEGAVTKEMMMQRDVNIQRIIVSPTQTVEQLRTAILRVINSELEKSEEDRVPLFFALDSLGMLTTESELESAMSGSNKEDMGRRAKLIKSTFRTITLKIGVLNCPFVITNHTYSSMSGYSGDKMGGGSGLEFAASIIVYLSKSKDKDSKKKLIGNNIKCTLEKGRFTKEGSQVTININFKYGMDRYYGLLPLMIEGGIVTKSGPMYKIGDKKYKGEKAFYKDIENILPEIDEELENFVKSKFGYGV